MYLMIALIEARRLELAGQLLETLMKLIFCLQLLHWATSSLMWLE